MIERCAQIQSIKIQGLCKSYSNRNNEIVVFNNFSIEMNSLVSAFFGPNGCGKTTLFQIICGLLEYHAGAIEINCDGSAEVKFGYVFQGAENFLFPWMSNMDNLTLPLKLKGVDKTRRHEKALALLRELDLELPLKVYPYQLSGGQRQLVAIARALIDDDVNVLLLDEPFENLDYLNTLRLLTKISKFIKTKGVLTLFISHDVEEAIFLADTVFSLSERPTEVLDKIEVDFPNRNIDIMYSTKFLNIKEQILKLYKPKLIETDLHDSQA